LLKAAEGTGTNWTPGSNQTGTWAA